MQFEGYKQGTRVPNLTPLIDIVFLLLIFFMLTSHFVREETINIELPHAETGNQLDVQDILEITLTANGKYYYRNNEYTVKQLEAVISTQLSQQQSKTVYIRGDQTSNLGNAIHVIDIARKSGARSVEVVTENHVGN